MHTPVLLEVTLRALDIKSGGRYIDATAGEGGHLKKILAAGGKVLAIDIDYEQIERLRDDLKNESGVLLTVGNFKNIEEIAREQDFLPVDGVVYDMGLSMGQIRGSGRGFSYQIQEEPLDMRLDLNQEITAADIINSLAANELYELFSKYSEELDSRAIAEAVYSANRVKRIERVKDLVSVLEKLGVNVKTKARIFQALRIAVNNEKENLELGLRGGLNLLKSGGKLAVITFHSLEDRWVKRFGKENEELIKKSSLIKSDSQNKFERSAKLRIIVKK